MGKKPGKPWFYHVFSYRNLLFFFAMNFGCVFLYIRELFESFVGRDCFFRV